ncbi:hypothetical protein KAR91_12625 [Candidatus Pacearchaeota archaeon]|nr:hypothetical protein [Candidatus Pacearchaeota archaeon]
MIKKEIVLNIENIISEMDYYLYTYRKELKRLNGLGEFFAGGKCKVHADQMEKLQDKLKEIIK